MNFETTKEIIMEVEQIIAVINELPVSYSSDKTKKRADVAITETSGLISSLLVQKGLRITKGGSNPSGRQSYSRIYLETLENTSHDHRLQNYQDTVIQVWEWQTKQSGYFKPLTCKTIITFCDELRQVVENYGVTCLDSGNLECPFCGTEYPDIEPSDFYYCVDGCGKEFFVKVEGE